MVLYFCGVSVMVSFCCDTLVPCYHDAPAVVPCLLLCDASLAVPYCCGVLILFCFNAAVLSCVAVLMPKFCGTSMLWRPFTGVGIASLNIHLKCCYMSCMTEALLQGAKANFLNT